jgi:hypothetical protein
MKAGGLGLLGQFFPGAQLPAAESSLLGASLPGKAKSVILLFLHGGAATQDMFDLKPDAPAEIRGEFSPIATSAPGVSICEHLPRMSKWMHKAAIVRSVNHNAGCHNTVPAFTGYTQMEPVQNVPSPNHPPSMGSVCEYLDQQSGRQERRLPAYVCLPHPLGWGELGRRPGIYAGYLGQRYDPMCTECVTYFDPGADMNNRPHPPEVRGEPRINAEAGSHALLLDRLEDRWSLLAQFDRRLRQVDQEDAIGGFARRHQQAYDLLTSPKLRSAFDLESEEGALRDRYGRTLFGSSVLVARKLVEAGVRFISVFWDNYNPRLHVADYGWDTHEHNFITLRDAFLPRLDLTYSALMEDLNSRGLLDETLVVVMSDFGRTPRINQTAGRDHWSYCYSVLLAGAGIRGGTVYGQSDPHAAAVREKPVSPADICATIYRCLGIDPDMPIYDRLNRPHPVGGGGAAIADILI